MIGSGDLEITEEDIKNNRGYYEVIGATKQKIDKRLYADKRVIKTHIRAVSAIKKAFAHEGIDPVQVKVLLYYNALTISDFAPAIIWQNKVHQNTLGSPWLDSTKTRVDKKIYHILASN